MTSKQFVKIAMALDMNIDQVAKTLTKWPSRGQIKRAAEAMAREYEDAAIDCSPSNANAEFHNRMMAKVEFLRSL